MKKQFILLILLIILVHLSALAQDRLKLTVNDKYGQVVGFSNVIINNSVQVLADKTGSIQLEKDKLHLQDTIVVSYLGYKPYELVVDESLLAASEKQVVLEEQVYNLDEVKVKTKFSALKFLKKKKKRFLLPYDKKRMVELEADVIRQVGDSIVHYQDSKMLLDYNYSTADSLLSSTQITDSLVKRAVIEAFHKASWMPLYYCYPSWRKCFTIKYLGKKDDQYVFLSTWKPKYAGKKRFRNCTKDDQFTVRFELNEAGYITHAQYHLIAAKDKNHCYRLDVVYKQGDCVMVPYSIYWNMYYKKSAIRLTTHEKII